MKIRNSKFNIFSLFPCTRENNIDENEKRRLELNKYINKLGKLEKNLVQTQENFLNDFYTLSVYPQAMSYDLFSIILAAQLCNWAEEKWINLRISICHRRISTIESQLENNFPRRNPS